jgi:hypothetical protein
MFGSLHVGVLLFQFLEMYLADSDVIFQTVNHLCLFLFIYQSVPREDSDDTDGYLSRII